MNEHTEKRIIAFTSQSFRQYGIRAVRMDDIAKNMTISKRTIYQSYSTKDNLVNTCWESYLSRMENLFQLIRYNNQDKLLCLWEISKAYIENLYKGECVFWMDVSRHSEYKYIYTTYNRIWSAELKQNIEHCLKEKYVMNELNLSIFLELFTSLLYSARIVGSLPEVLRNSAYFMLRGIMTEQGMERFKSLQYS